MASDVMREASVFTQFALDSDLGIRHAEAPPSETCIFMMLGGVLVTTCMGARAWGRGDQTAGGKSHYASQRSKVLPRRSNAWKQKQSHLGLVFGGPMGYPDSWAEVGESWRRQASALRLTSRPCKSGSYSDCAFESSL
jgi:hypothetical protein